MSSIVRQRRYVSAPAGTYPAPEPPQDAGRAIAEPEPAAEHVPTEADIGDEIDASLAAASAPRQQPRVEQEPAEEREPSLPQMPDLPKRERDPSPARPSKRKRSGSPAAGMIVGGLVGAVLGVAAGLLLLAVTEGQGGLTERLGDPAALFDQVSDPLALWNGVSDWLIRMSAVLVAGGFLLLGIGWGGRIGSRRRR